MRLVLLTVGLAISVCAVPNAFCQSAQPGLLNPAQPQPSQPTFQFPGKDFSKQPPTWQNSNVPTTHVLVLPRTDAPRNPLKQQLDPGIFIHPPKSHIGDQPQGSLVAQNLYPGLRILPIGAATLKPIPTKMPNAKLEPIPLTAPDARAIFIDSNPANLSPAK